MACHARLHDWVRSANSCLCQLLDVRIGLKSDLSFRPRLARALRDLCVALDMDLAHLVAALAADASLLDQLLERVTIQETGFFRHPEQFETVLRGVLPTINAPLLAWSAACANGQEAYSMAMLFGEAGRTGTVLATDISPAALRRTSDGCYHDREMTGVSAPRRRQHFTVSPDGWQINQNLRDTVVAQRHNLIDPIPPRVTHCQIVMCRNVLIYFSEPHARLFLDRLADAMDPAGYLFVGGAETLWQATDRFEPVQVGTSYVYRPLRRGVKARTAVAPRGVSTIRSTVAAVTDRLRPLVPVSPKATIRSRDAGQLSDVTDDQEEIGRQHLADGLVTEAIVAFRRWSYQCPDDPVAHFQMGVALDRADEHTTARRAYRAALAALDRCDPDQLAAALHGYDRSELRRLLVDRCSGPAPISVWATAERPEVKS
jgi:chemotaxis protein methyltransferase CheR